MEMLVYLISFFIEGLSDDPPKSKFWRWVRRITLGVLAFLIAAIALAILIGKLW